MKEFGPRRGGFLNAELFVHRFGHASASELARWRRSLGIWRNPRSDSLVSFGMIHGEIGGVEIVLTRDPHNRKRRVARRASSSSQRMVEDPAFVFGGRSAPWTEINEIAKDP